MNRLPHAIALLVLLATMVVSWPVSGNAGQEMATAASAFLDTLDSALRERACFGFDEQERLNWHFIPKERPGVALKEMGLAQRRAAHRLLRLALSDKGYLKATAIMALEEILRVLEHDRPNVDSIRDQEKYHFSVFGDPAEEGTWGWRVEGHHLSLNFSLHAGQVIAVTPSFYGANPAEVRVGPRAGLRVLGHEEDLARAIMASTNDGQKRQAVISTKAPRDVITGPGQPFDIKKPAGLPATQMTEAQRQLLRELVSAFAHNLRQDLAEKELAEIEQAGFDKIRFAWAGSLQRGQEHYFRVHGPTFIIEYDNTQNQANHIHTVWHSLTGDFGLDVLRRHYKESPHHASR